METKKTSLITAALAEMASKASDHDKPILQDAINKLWSNQTHIDGLQTDLKAEKDARTKDKTEFETRLEEDRIGFDTRNLIEASNTIYDELDADVKFMTVSKLVDIALQKKGLHFKVGEKGKMQLFDKDGLKVYGSNNTVVTPEIFIGGVLLQNKVLREPGEKPVEGDNDQERQFNNSDEPQTFLAGNNQTVANINKQSREAFIANQ